MDRQTSYSQRGQKGILILNKPQPSALGAIGLLAIEMVGKPFVGKKCLAQM
jgi:hypothetical protein